MSLTLKAPRLKPWLPTFKNDEISLWQRQIVGCDLKAETYTGTGAAMARVATQAKMMEAVAKRMLTDLKDWEVC